MQLLAQDPERMQAFLRKLERNPAFARELRYDWSKWGRPEQQLPAGEEWSIWVAMGGRGWGKTRAGSEFARKMAQIHPVGMMVARTAADLRDTMIEGQSGVLACSPPWARPLYEPAKRRLTWPNGAITLLRSADAPESLRGPNVYWFWADEGASWRIAPVRPGEPAAPVREPDAWSQLMMTWRLGRRPLGFLSTTPRPLKWLRELIRRDDVVVTRGSSYDNLGNLSPAFQRNVLARYAGTRLGRQEIDAELLEDVDGALWTIELFDQHRRAGVDARSLLRIVVGVDPAGSHRPGSDFTGLVVVARGLDGRGYLLEDASLQASPAGWSRRAVELVRKWGADAIVAETNYGGEMVAHTIHTADPLVRVVVVTATRGKVQRAEPVAALYEQGRVSHVGERDDYGRSPFAELEEQARNMTPTGYVGEGSPDRLDAMVWGFTELFLAEQELTLAGALIEEPGMISPI